MTSGQTDLPDSQGGQGRQSSNQGRRNLVDKPPRHNDLLLGGQCEGESTWPCCRPGKRKSSEHLRVPSVTLKPRRRPRLQVLPFFTGTTQAPVGDSATTTQESSHVGWETGGYLPLNASSRPTSRGPAKTRRNPSFYAFLTSKTVLRDENRGAVQAHLREHCRDFGCGLLNDIPAI